MTHHQLTDRQATLLCHALGIADRANFKPGPAAASHRNHFLTTGGPVTEEWEALEELGLASTFQVAWPIVGGAESVYWRVTPAGREAIDAVRATWGHRRER